MRRKRSIPDSRPDWRDPNMPVIRNYKMGNGKQITEVDQDYEHRYREHLMQVSDNPGYKIDPTYNMRKR